MRDDKDDDADLRSEINRKAAIDAFRNRPESETGWDRLREFYTFKHIEYLEFEPSPEMRIVNGLFGGSLLLGLVTGFFNHWNKAKETYIRQNKGNKFLNQKEYMKEAYQYQLKFSVRHGLRLGLRLGLFSGGYCLSIMSLAMYNNHLGVKEYALSGLLTGSLWQSRIGLRGAFVGGTVGGLLGLFGGFAVSKIMEYENEDFASIRYQIHMARQGLLEKEAEMKTKLLVDELVTSAKEELQKDQKA